MFYYQRVDGRGLSTRNLGVTALLWWSNRHAREQESDEQTCETVLARTDGIFEIHRYVSPSFWKGRSTSPFVPMPALSMILVLLDHQADRKGNILKGQAMRPRSDLQRDRVIPRRVRDTT